MSAPAPEASAAAFTLRTARLVDAERIFALIHLHRDRLVPRSLGSIVENIDRFVVAESDGEMVGCATYAIFPEIGAPLHTAVEIQSVAVRAPYRRRGIGRAVVEAIASKVAPFHPKEVLVLTFAPEFFTALGFHEIPKTKTRLTDPVARAKMTEKTRKHFEKIMAEVRAADFKYITAVSIHTYWNPEDKVDPFILGTDYLKALIDEFHAHGVKVCSIPFEGGDKEEVYHRLWELGCDGFSTDYPSVMFKVIHDLKAAAKK